VKQFTLATTSIGARFRFEDENCWLEGKGYTTLTLHAAP
jgi:hypothetical protein